MGDWLDDIVGELVPPDPWCGLGVSLHPKQQIAEDLANRVDELLFGGAAGPGKSFWGLAHAAAEMLRHPGNRGVVFRREVPSLKRSILQNAKELLSPFAKFNALEGTFTFPNGSVLEFSGLQHEDSVYKYQGAEYGLLFFEELTEFTESQYLYMLSRLRAPVDGVRPHVICTSNPGNEGHVWVKRRFIKPKPADLQPGEPMPEVMEPWSTHEEGKQTRVFVPATIMDNPTLIERDPGYLERLLEMPARLQAAYLHGDWDAIEMVEGALWSRTTLERSRVVPRDLSVHGTANIEGVAPEMIRVVVGVDPAVSSSPDADDTGIVAVGKGADGHVYVLDDMTCHLPADGGPDEDGWARLAVRCALKNGAHQLAAEVNQGGDLVLESLKRAIEQLRAEGVDTHGMYVVPVHARLSKAQRAAPWSMLWGGETPTAHIVGRLDDLEEEMTMWVPGTKRTRSPNRIDAMTTALYRMGMRPRSNTTQKVKDDSSNLVERLTKGAFANRGSKRNRRPPSIWGP